MAGCETGWRVTLVDTFADWNRLQPEWNRLAGARVFCRFEWMRQWWQTYGFDSGRPFIVVVWDDEGRVRGLAPWWLQTTITHGRLLQFLGSGDICSDDLTLMSEPADHARVGRAVARWLAAAGGWDVLELDGVLQDDPAVRAFVEASREFGCPVSRREAMSCWKIDLPASWEAYLARLSKSRRKQIRRIDRRCLETGRYRLKQAVTERDRQRVFAELVRLHQLRWQAAGEPGAFASPRFLRFLQRMTSEWFSEGRVRLYELVDHDRTWAAEIHFVHDRVSHAYQSGVDPRGRDDDVGHVLNVAIIRQLIDEGMKALDFLRGDEPYKSHLRAEPRAANWFRIGAPQWHGRARHQAWVAGGLVKSWAKTALGRKEELA